MVTTANFLIDAESNLKAALKSFSEATTPDGGMPGHAQQMGEKK